MDGEASKSPGEPWASAGSPAPRLGGGRELRAGLLAQRTSRKPVPPEAKSRARGVCLVPKPLVEVGARLSLRQPFPSRSLSGWGDLGPKCACATSPWDVSLHIPVLSTATLHCLALSPSV